jgi:glycosyltransferase 2 family protein
VLSRLGLGNIERVPFGVAVKMDRKAWLTFAVAIVLAGVLLYFSLRGLDWQELSLRLRSAKLDLVALALLLQMVNLWLRSFRWRVLLNASQTLPVGSVFWASSLGYLGNNVLPARMGELLRVEAIKRRHSTSRSYVMATALIERVMDAGVLVLFTSAALLTFKDLPETLHRACQTFSVLSAIGILTLFLLPHAEAHVQRMLESFPIVKGIAERFLEGLRSLHSWGRSFQFLALTLIIWPVDSYTGVKIAEALGITMSFPTAMVVLAALGLSSAMPSTPGYVGVFQFVAVTVLKPFGIDREAAIAWVLLYQAVGYVTQCGFGAVGFFMISQGAAASDTPNAESASG